MGEKAFRGLVEGLEVVGGEMGRSMSSLGRSMVNFLMEAEPDKAWAAGVAGEEGC